MIIEKLKVDESLLHLQNVLFDLDNYSFDRDILELLNTLKSLVDNKLYSNFNLNNLDIEKTEIIVKYYLKDNNIMGFK